MPYTDFRPGMIPTLGSPQSSKTVWNTGNKKKKASFKRYQVRLKRKMKKRP